MAISRPLLLALIGAVLVGATFFVAMGARDASTGGTAAVAPAAATPQAAAAKPAAAKLSAGDTLEAALSTPAVKSGRFEGSASVSGTGSDGKVKASGSFQLGGPTDMPEMDVRLTVDGAGQDVDAGFVSTGAKAYLLSDGTAYALPDDVWSQAVQARSTPTAGQAAPTLAALGLDPSAWVRDVQDQGTEEIDGVETRHVSATIDAGAALRDVAKATGQAGGVALPPNVAAGVEDAKLDAWVGTEDKIIRRVTADIGFGDATVDVDFRLREVNDPQTIDTPENVSDALPAGLLGGATPAFAQGLSLATGAPPEALELPANDNPRRLDRAVGAHRDVVLFFRQQKGLDDQATAEAVRALDRRTRVLVLSDDVRNADRYGKLVEDLGVTQAPSIVIVDRAGKARLIEGYVDAESLVQEVSDAR